MPPFHLFLIASWFVPEAHAWIYVGSPTVNGVIWRPEDDIVSGSTTWVGVRMHACGGGYTDYLVLDDVDPTQPLSVAIDPGDWCSASFVWFGDVDIMGDDWWIRYGGQSTTVVLDGSSVVSAPLTPFDVIDGTFSGSNPRLYVSID